MFGMLLAGACAAVSIFASDREQYLAAAGPTPIRLQLDAARVDPAKALPPLHMSDAVEKTKAENASPTATSEPTPLAPASPLDPGHIKYDTSVLLQPLPIETNNEPAPKQESMNQVSPQMLLRYFTRNGTNEVLVPYTVDFTPPVPRRTGQSSAVYISE